MAPASAQGAQAGAFDRLCDRYDANLQSSAEYLAQAGYDQEDRFLPYATLATLSRTADQAKAALQDRALASAQRFLNRYVSLAIDAGEADATLPTDLRVAYLGGEKWARRRDGPMGR